MNKGRHRECQRTDQARSGAQQKWPCSRQRQVDRDQRGKNFNDGNVQQGTQKEAQSDRSKANQQQQRHKPAQYLSRCGPKGFQHPDMIKMALRVAVRRKAYRNAGKQYPEQTAQEQKTLGAIQGAPNPRTAFAHTHPLIIRLQRQGPSQILQFNFVARQQQTIGQTATRLNNLGCSDILHVREQTRAQIKNGPTAIRFGNQYPCHGQFGHTHFNAIAKI